MITMVNKVTSWQYPRYKYVGLSTDDKDALVGVPENSTFKELDTGVEYYFSDGSWNEAPTASGSNHGSGSGSGGGSAERFVVTLTQSGGTWSADESIADIVAANTAGKTVAFIASTDAPIEYYDCFIVGTEEMNMCGFSGVNDSGHPFALFGVNDGSADSWMYFDGKELPSYTSSQNGKVLGVANAQLSWVNPLPTGSVEEYDVLTYGANGWYAGAPLNSPATIFMYEDTHTAGTYYGWYDDSAEIAAYYGHVAAYLDRGAPVLLKFLPTQYVTDGFQVSMVDSVAVDSSGDVTIKVRFGSDIITMFGSANDQLSYSTI